MTDLRKLGLNERQIEALQLIGAGKSEGLSIPLVLRIPTPANCTTSHSPANADCGTCADYTPTEASSAPGDVKITHVYYDGLVPRVESDEFGSGQAIWNNKGDCGHLCDSTGAEVSTYCY